MGHGSPPFPPPPQTGEEISPSDIINMDVFFGQFLESVRAVLRSGPSYEVLCVVVVLLMSPLPKGEKINHITPPLSLSVGVQGQDISELIGEMTFEVLLSDGETSVELVPDGANVSVKSDAFLLFLLFFSTSPSHTRTLMNARMHTHTHIHKRTAGRTRKSSWTCASRRAPRMPPHCAHLRLGTLPALPADRLLVLWQSRAPCT